MAPRIELKDIPANDARDFFVAVLPKMANHTEFKDFIHEMYSFMPGGTAKTTGAQAEEIVKAIRAHEFHGSAEDLVSLHRTKDATSRPIPNHRVMERGLEMVHATARKRKTRKQHGGQPRWMRHMIGFGVFAVSSYMLYNNPSHTFNGTHGEAHSDLLLFSVLTGASVGIVGNVLYGYLDDLFREHHAELIAEQRRAEQRRAEQQRAEEQQFVNVLTRVFPGLVELLAAAPPAAQEIEVPPDTTNAIRFDTIATGDAIIRLGASVNGRMMYHYFNRDGLTEWWRTQDQRGEPRTNPTTSTPIDDTVEILYGIARVPGPAGGRRNTRKLRRTRKQRKAGKN